MREDNQLLVITHLCQLIGLVTGVGGFIVPLIIWLTQRDKVAGMDEHGKEILNFQLSLIIYSLICVPLIFLFGIGVLFLILIGLLGLIFPIINAIKTSNGETPHYPLAITIIK